MLKATKKILENFEIHLRRISQLTFLAVFIYLFIGTQTAFEDSLYKVYVGGWCDIFFRSDPLAIITAALASREILPVNYFPAIALILAAIFFGRFFCGWICPLGTCIDIAGASIKGRHKKRRTIPKRYSQIKYYILIVVFLLALAMVNIAGFLDPITILFRTMTFSFDPAISKVIRAIHEKASDYPTAAKIADPLYRFVSEKFLTFEPYKFKHSYIYFGIFLLILLLNLFYRRFWCSVICPLGAIYGYMGKVSLCKRVVDETCNRCGKCARECKMGAINQKSVFEYDKKECILCLSCQSVCPKEAITFPINNLSEHKQDFSLNAVEQHPTVASASKRGLLISLGAAAFSYPLIKMMKPSQGADIHLLRPPGVINEAEFLRKCIRCGECMRVCTRNALHPSLTISGAEGLWSPVLIPRVGYCEYYCNLCGKVCPTGAIRHLPLSHKETFKIGIAEFNHKRCLPWSRQINCSVCEEACPLPKKAISLIEKTVTDQNGEQIIVKYPYVNTELCIGCGICENKCPLEGDSAIRVKRLV